MTERNYNNMTIPFTITLKKNNNNNICPIIN